MKNRTLSILCLALVLLGLVALVGLLGGGAPVAHAQADKVVLVDDEATTDRGTPTSLNVLDNDTAPDDWYLVLYHVDDPANGYMGFDGSGWVVYFPDPDFTGTDVFDYYVQVCRTGGTIGDCLPVPQTATVTIHVAGPPPPAESTLYLPVIFRSP